MFLFHCIISCQMVLFQIVNLQKVGQSYSAIFRNYQKCQMSKSTNIPRKLLLSLLSFQRYNNLNLLFQKVGQGHGMQFS